VAVQAFEGLSEGLEGGTLGEECIEAGRQERHLRRVRVVPVRLEVGIQVPDLATHPGLLFTRAVVEGNPFVYPPFRMDPAQGVEQEGKWPGPITDDDPVEGTPGLHQPTPQRPFGGDAAMTFDGDPQGVQRLHPAVRIGDPVGRLGVKMPYRLLGQSLFAPIGEGLLIEVVAEAPTACKSSRKLIRLLL